VKHAAAEHVPLAAVMQPKRLALLAQLLHAEPSVAVLAAEVLCRVCSQELQPWGSQLVKVVPDLLALVEQCSSSSSSSRGSSSAGSSSSEATASSSNSSAEVGDTEGVELTEQQQRLPLLFFAVSALVRMSSDSEVAAAVVACGGVPVLVHALRVSPPAVCQVRLAVAVHIV
jgi:hypothetical protein